MIPETNRTIIRQRQGLTEALMALCDGLAVIVVSWTLIVAQLGVLTTEYALLMLLLLGTLAVVFDQEGIYRKERGFTQKAFAIFRAWSLSFLILTLLGFLTKQGETYSRVLVAQLYVAGLGSHLLLHLAFYFVRRRWVGSRMGGTAAYRKCHRGPGSATLTAVPGLPHRPGTRSTPWHPAPRRCARAWRSSCPAR